MKEVTMSFNLNVLEILELTDQWLHRLAYWTKEYSYILSYNQTVNKQELCEVHGQTWQSNKSNIWRC